MNIYQVICVFKQDLETSIQIMAAYESFEDAQNYIHLIVKYWGEIDGPRCNMLGDFGEYIASCHIIGTPFAFADYYIKTCSIVDKIGQP